MTAHARTLAGFKACRYPKAAAAAAGQWPTSWLEALLCACSLYVQQCGSKLAAAMTVWCQENSPEISPLGLILELDILCPSGILRAFTMPSPSKAELKTLQTRRLLWHARLCCPVDQSTLFLSTTRS